MNSMARLCICTLSELFILYPLPGVASVAVSSKIEMASHKRYIDLLNVWRRGGGNTSDQF